MNTNKIRYILNIIFLIGAVISIILYFSMEDKHLFFYVCGASIFLKLMEFFMRYMR
ncbi:MAG: hypothetical protein RR319_09750 [Bacteroides sp.]